jgi:hypothetical protein
VHDSQSGSANFIVRNNGEIDEETKYPGAKEIPEAHCSKEHNSPIVREWRIRAGSSVRKVSGITSAAEKTAPNAMWIAGSPEKYTWCIVPIIPPAE